MRQRRSVPTASLHTLRVERVSYDTDQNDEVLVIPPSSQRTSANKRPKFSWETIHRQALHILRDRYSCGWDLTTSVFNEIFKDDLIAQGLPSGLDKGRLSAQWNERNKENQRSWQKVLLSPDQAELCAEIKAEMKLQMTSRTCNHPESVLQADQVQPRSQDQEPPSPPQTPQSSRTTAQKITVGARLISRFADPEYHYEPVSAEKAHPPKPALLYRYYDDNSFGKNGNDGFVASQFQHLNGPLPPAPASSDIRMFADIENHMNRNPVASPFISVASDLFWVFRLAMKRVQEGALHPRLSIIQAEAIQTQDAFYAPLFHEQLKNRKVFTNGAWYYRGTSEFLIWAEIQPEAIMVDQSFTLLRESVAGNPVLKEIMQLDQIAERSSSATLARQLRASSVPLNVESTIAIARFLLLLGMDASTPPSMLAKVVADFIRGWKLTIDTDSLSRWETLAGTFAYIISEGERGLIDQERLDLVKEAFLWGLRSGLGDLNWQWNEAKTLKMTRKANAAGITDTSAITPTRSVPATPSSRRPRRSTVPTPASGTPRGPATATRGAAFRSGTRRLAVPATPTSVSSRRRGRSGDSGGESLSSSFHKRIVSVVIEREAPVGRESPVEQDPPVEKRTNEREVSKSHQREVPRSRQREVLVQMVDLTGVTSNEESEFEAMETDEDDDDDDDNDDEMEE